MRPVPSCHPLGIWKHMETILLRISALDSQAGRIFNASWSSGSAACECILSAPDYTVSFTSSTNFPCSLKGTPACPTKCCANSLFAWRISDTKDPIAVGCRWYVIGFSREELFHIWQLLLGGCISTWLRPDLSPCCFQAPMCWKKVLPTKPCKIIINTHTHTHIYIYTYTYVNIYVHISRYIYSRTHHYTYITIHTYITLHHITSHYITLHCIALHCIGLHCITYTNTCTHAYIA